MYLVIVIKIKYEVYDIVSKMKINKKREISKSFNWIKKIY